MWVNEKEKLSLAQAFQHMIITQFFNGITPFSTGGQPMEIYMLKNHGFRYTKATNVIMQNFIVYQLALVIFGLFKPFVFRCGIQIGIHSPHFFVFMPELRTLWIAFLHTLSTATIY